MYPHSVLWHYLWIAPIAVQLLIIVAMIRRKLVSEFPIFLSYAIVQTAASTTLFLLDHSPDVTAEQYWRAHWYFLALTTALRFGVIYEIFSSVFRPYAALARLSRILLRWTAAVLLIVAVLVTAHATPGPEPTMLFSVHVLEIGVAIMQSGLLLFLFMFSSYFRISWKSYLFGIAAGFGLFSILTLAKESISVATGPAPGSYVLDFIIMAAYHCSVLIWITYLLIPESQGRALRTVPNNDLEEWNHEMQRLLLQ